MKNTRLNVKVLAGLLMVGLFTLLLCNPISAQVDDYAEDKAERAEKRTKRRADNEVNRTIDKEVDKAFNKVKGLFKKKDKKKNKGKKEEVETEINTEVETEVETDEREDDSSFSIPGMEKKEINTVYKFDESFLYDFVSTDGKSGKEDTDKFEMLIPKEKSANYMSFRPAEEKQRDDGFMVWDLDKKAMLTLDTKRKQGSYMEYEEVMNQAIEDFEDDGEVTFRKTGNTGTMLGLSYVEYELLTEEAEGLLWISSEYSYNLFSMMNKCMKKKKFESMGLAGLDGLLIRSESTQKESGDKFIMELTAINKADVSIDASQYEIIDMSSLMRGM